MMKPPLPRSFYLLSFIWKESCRELSARQLYNQPFKSLTTYPPCSHVCFHVAQIHFGTGKRSFLPCWCTRAGSHHCPSNTHPCLRNTQVWVSVTASSGPRYRNKKGLAHCLSPEDTVTLLSVAVLWYLSSSYSLHSLQPCTMAQMVCLIFLGNEG